MSNSWTTGGDSSQGQERPVIIGGWRGPGWRVVDADPDQVRQVRGWIRAAINRPDSPVDPDEAALVISNGMVTSASTTVIGNGT